MSDLRAAVARPSAPPDAAGMPPDGSSILAGMRQQLQERRRTRRIRLAIAAGLAGAMCLGLWLWLREPGEAVRWVQAEQRPLRRMLRELGTVVAKNETHVFSLFTGEIVWKIEEGRQVEAGEVIVRFNAQATLDETERMTKELFDKEEAVRRTEADLENTRLRYEMEVAQKKAALEKARVDRDLTYGHPTAIEKREAELALATAKLKHDQAAKDYESNKELHALGYVTEAALKQKALKQASEKAELAKAEVLHRLTLQGYSSDSKRQADLAVADADKNLATSVFNRDADLAIKQAELDLNRIELRNFNRSLEQKKRELESSEVKAPVAGRVAFVDVYKGGGKGLSPIQIGEMRNRGQDLCKVVDTSTLRVNVWVNEADVPRLAEGQAAEVRLSAFSERAFSGRVAVIAPVAQDKNVANTRLALLRSGEAFVNVVAVALDFTDLSEADRTVMRLGFTAEVKIDCTKPGDEVPRLVLPWTAVHLDASGGARVKVARGTGASAYLPVKLGRSDADYVEILGGIEPGARAIDSGKGAQAAAIKGAPAP